MTAPFVIGLIHGHVRALDNSLVESFILPDGFSVDKPITALITLTDGTTVKLTTEIVPTRFRRCKECRELVFNEAPEGAPPLWLTEEDNDVRCEASVTHLHVV